MLFEFRVSVVVPVYNVKRFLARCVKSLIGQTISNDDYEIVLIDDGSTDGSAELCDVLAKRYSNVEAYHQAHSGASVARNAGIERARGKYLAFVDGDDRLAPNTLEAAVGFFDSVYEQVDLVAYPSTSVKGGKAQPPHYRYERLQESGVYDLSVFSNCYAHITRIEYLVKNDGGTIRFDESMAFQEDLKYSCEILRDKMKVGFCDGGMYYYEVRDNGSQAKLLNADRIFESSMSFWEQLFAAYHDNPPAYFQALYLNDVSWKLNCEALVPTLSGPAFAEQAQARVRRLLNRIDVRVVDAHPRFDDYRKAAFRIACCAGPLEYQAEADRLAVHCKGSTIYEEERIGLFVHETCVEGDLFRMGGYLRSPCFRYSGKPSLAVIRREGKGKEHQAEVFLRRIECNDAPVQETVWRLDIEQPIGQAFELRFCAEVDNVRLPVRLDYLPWSKLSPSSPTRMRYAQGGVEVGATEDALSLMPISAKTSSKILEANDKRVASENRKIWLIRKWMRAVPRKQRAHLYVDYLESDAQERAAYDCFQRDLALNDGVTRYYVTNHSSKKTAKGRAVRFGSVQHKYLTLGAQRVLTPRAESRFCLPFSQKGINWFTDLIETQFVVLGDDEASGTLSWKRLTDCLPMAVHASDEAPIRVGSSKPAREERQS